MSIDALLNRQYDPRNYNCAHLVAEAWVHETGRNITDKLSGFLFPPVGRFVPLSLRREFVTLKKPVSPCVVLMRRPGQPPHVGIFIRGRVFHIQESGPQFQPLDVATFGFSSVRFYACRP